MHARKFFLRMVAPGDKVEAVVGIEQIARMPTGAVLSKTTGKARVRCRYKRRAEPRGSGNHVVLVGLSTEVLVHSKQLFEIEGWRVRVHGEPQGGPSSDEPPFPAPPVALPNGLAADVVDELYLAMKARRDRFMKSRRTPVPEAMVKALQAIAQLAGKPSKV